MTLENRWRALVLDLLAQILVKVQAGPTWGEDEAGCGRLVRKAGELIAELEPAAPRTDKEGGGR